MTIRQVRLGEKREVVRHGAGPPVTYLVDEDRGTRIREIPHDGPADDEWPLCAVRIDQGSIGMAGGSFVEDGLTDLFQQLILVIFDKIHRCIRDIAGVADSGICRDARMKWNHISI